MATHRVEVLRPGRRCVGKNRDGSKRFVEFTPGYCKTQFERNNALIKAGIQVPIAWEHRSDQKPRKLSLDDWRSEKAKGTLGYVDVYELEPDGRVMAKVSIPDAEDARRAEVVKFCSPEIDAFTDGNGKDWGDVFTHVALTPRPRQHEQEPITRLSMDGPIRLAIDPQKGTDMADDDKKPDDDEDVIEEGEETSAEATAPEPEPETPKPPEKPSGAPASLGEALNVLAAVGLVIKPEGTTPENLLERIIVAGTAIQGMENNAMASNGSNNGDVAPVSAPLAMSLEATTKAHEKQLAQAMGLARKDMTSRIQRLVKSGRITPVMGGKLIGNCGKVQLSFNDDGDLNRNELLIQIEAYEALPKSNAFQTKGDRVQLSNVDAVPHPAAEERSDEKALADWDKT